MLISREVKSFRMWSWTTRLDAVAGSTRSSGRPKFTFRNGAPSRRSSATIPIAIGPGRRMTTVARRCQNPVPSALGFRRHSTSESTRLPRTAMNAGSTTTAASAASATTAMPAYANDRRKYSGNTSSAASETPTVSALNSTVRPAVSTDRTTASCIESPFRTSSRYLDTMNSA